MGWLDNQEAVNKNSKTITESKDDFIEIQMPEIDKWFPVNKNNCFRLYNDELSSGPLFIIIDEVAELFLRSGGKSQAEKEEDELRSECEMIVKSITQLGRSAGIHIMLCTQRASASLLSGDVLNNCGMRVVCGRLTQIPSMMALGNTYATTIPGNIPGRGCIMANGEITNIQYYFSEPTWIDEWFKERGLNKFGYLPENPNDLYNTDEVHMEFDGIEQLPENKEKIHFEFAGIEGEINKNKEQNFEEL